jgi:hypothetical protein
MGRSYLESILGRNGLGGDARIGALIGLALGVGALIFVYLVLLLDGTLGDPGTPGNAGLAAFAMMHGGDVSAKGSLDAELASILGISANDLEGFISDLGGSAFSLPRANLDGTMRFGLPALTPALLVFAAAVFCGRFALRRIRSAGVFVLSFATAYAAFVCVAALLGAASFDATELIGLLGPGFGESGLVTFETASSLRFGPGAPSNTAWGFAWAGFGAAMGAGIIGRGLSALPAWTRPVLRGASWAVVFSVTLSVLISAALLASGSGSGEFGSAAREGGTSFLLAMLPAMAADVWLLAHGVPLVHNPPALEAALQGRGAPASVGLLGGWEAGGGWRLLLVAPVVGLVAGGWVAARKVARERRLLTGALVAVPYVLAVLVSSVVFGGYVEFSVSGISEFLREVRDLPLSEQLAGTQLSALEAVAGPLEEGVRLSVGTPTAWLLACLPIGAVLGALGGLLAQRAGASSVGSPSAPRAGRPGFVRLSSRVASLRPPRIAGLGARAGSLRSPRIDTSAARGLVSSRRGALAVAGIVLGVLVLLVVVRAFGGDGVPSMDGEWRGSGDVDQAGTWQGTEMRLFLVQSEGSSAVRGTGTVTLRWPTQSRTMDLEDVTGQVNDGDVSLVARGEAGDEYMTVNVEGSLRGNRLEGVSSVVYGTYGAGSMSAGGTFEAERVGG